MNEKRHQPKSSRGDDYNETQHRDWVQSWSVVRVGNVACAIRVVNDLKLWCNDQRVVGFWIY